MKLDPYIGDVRVECAFATAPDDPTPAFVDISDYAIATAGITITRGRGDEYATVQPGKCQLTLDNTNGYFTAGYAGSPFYPNVKIRKKLRVTFRAAGSASGNHLTANAASMETNVSSWVPLGTGAPTLSQSTTHAEDGTKALLATWATAASGSGIAVTSDYALPLVTGRTYTAQLRVYVPTGSPAVAAVAPDVTTTVIGTPTVSAVNDAFTTVSVTFIAGVAKPNIGIATAGASTAGQQCWVDKVMVDEGSAVGTFTTSLPPISYRFTGYVEEWPTEWPGGGDYSEVQVTAIDRFKRFGQAAAFRSIIEQEYLLDSPLAYYTLGEPSDSATAGDTSKNGCNPLATTQLGSGGTLTFGNATGPGTDGLTALQLAPVNATNGKYLSGALGKISSISTAGQSAECFFLTSTAAVQSLVTLVGSAVNPLSLSITAAGKLQGASFDGSGVVTSSASVNDGLTHHAAVVQSYSSGTTTITLYLDGTSVGTTSFSNSLQPFSTMRIGGSTGSVFNGTVAHAACYDSALSAARVAAHSTAGSTGFSGERSDQRIARYAGYIGIPAAEQALETGLSASVAFSDITGQPPLSAMQDIEATESGILYIDGQGRLAFQSRNHRYNAASVLTLAGEDIDPGAKFIENDALMINDVTASRPGGITFRAVNQQSILDFGPAGITPTLLTTSDNEVIDAANWKANQTAIPAPRLPNLAVDILTNPAIASAVLAWDISSRITVGTLPQYAPAQSVDVFIEGWSENISDSGYTFAFNTSPAPQSGVWQLDSSTYSVLGTSTRLAY